MEDTGFSIRSTDAGFLDYVDRFLGEARVDRHSGDLPVWLFSADHRSSRTIAGGKVVHGISTLWLQSLRIYRDRGGESMAGRLFSKMRDLATEPQNEYVLLRAAAVSVDGRAIVMPSLPSHHLPAFTARLLQETKGLFLGDEVIKLDPILRRISPVGFPLLIDERQVHLFPEGGFSPVRKRRKEPRYLEGATPRRPLALSAIGASGSDSAPIGWIIFPEFAPGEATRLEPWGGSPSVFRFMQATLNLHVWGDRVPLLAQELLAAQPVSRLVAGSIDEATALVASEIGVLESG